MERRDHLVRPFDMGDPEGIAEWLAGIVTETGPLDGLAHCAGITSLMPLRVLSVKHATEVNARELRIGSGADHGCFRGKARAPDRQSSIVLVASVAGSVGVAGEARHTPPARARSWHSRGRRRWSWRLAASASTAWLRLMCATAMYERNLKR